MLKWHTDLLYKEELHPTLAAASAFRLGCVGQSSAHSWADTTWKLTACRNVLINDCNTVVF